MTTAYYYEAEEVARRVAMGERESPGMPWAKRLDLAGIMDQIRDVGGLVHSSGDIRAVPLG